MVAQFEAKTPFYIFAAYAPHAELATQDKIDFYEHLENKWKSIPKGVQKGGQKHEKRVQNGCWDANAKKVGIWGVPFKDPN